MTSMNIDAVVAAATMEIMRKVRRSLWRIVCGRELPVGRGGVIGRVYVEERVGGGRRGCAEGMVLRLRVGESVRGVRLAL